MITVARPINGISLNGLEYLKDENGDNKMFYNFEEAAIYLMDNGYEDYTYEDFEDSFIFEEEPDR